MMLAMSMEKNFFQIRWRSMCSKMEFISWYVLLNLEYENNKHNDMMSKGHTMFIDEGNVAKISSSYLRKVLYKIKFFHDYSNNKVLIIKFWWVHKYTYSHKHILYFKSLIQSLSSFVGMNKIEKHLSLSCSFQHSCQAFVFGIRNW